MTNDPKTPVTRFDTFTRPATDEDDERDVVRLFNKRKLVGEYDTAEITRTDWEDDLKGFIASTKGGKPRKVPATLGEVIDWLGEETNEDDEDEREPGSVVPEKYRQIYGSAQNCGDEIAQVLTAFVTMQRATKKNPDGGLDRARLRAVAEINGIADKLAEWEARGLNGGLLRMNTSNVLRGMNRRGEQVQIGEQVWEARDVPKRERKGRGAAKVAKSKTRKAA